MAEFTHVDQFLTYCVEEKDLKAMDTAVEAMNMLVGFVPDSFYAAATYSAFNAAMKRGTEYARRRIAAICLLGAVRMRKMDDLRRLVETPCVIDRCVIYYAAIQGYWEAVKYLLDQGCDYDEDVAGLAAVAGQWDVIRSIVACGHEYKYRVLGALIDAGKQAEMLEFIVEAKIDMKAQPAHLMYRAYAGGHFKLFEYLREAIDKPLDADWYKGFIRAGDVANIRRLHAYACPINAGLLEYAQMECEHNKPEVLAVLHEYCAD